MTFLVLTVFAVGAILVVSAIEDHSIVQAVQEVLNGKPGSGVGWGGLYQTFINTSPPVSGGSSHTVR